MERIKQNYYSFLNIDIDIRNIFRIENVLIFVWSSSF